MPNQLTSAERRGVSAGGAGALGYREPAALKDYAPENLSLLKKIVLSLVRSVPMGKNGKMSMRIKRKAAAWDDDVRAQFLGLALL
ncbi:hypothetical protein J9884_20410 [Chromobacterium violaceum]|nr:hypothetical protein [Chromobacterium violaceum]